jgi:hypothetical protein
MRKGAAPSHDRRVKSDRVCAVLSRRRSALAKISRCPLKDRQPHSAKIPGKLTDAAVRHIEQQITTKGSRALPYLGLANHFYRCRDCYAVWAASSAFDRVSEDRVYGFYDHILQWKPYP